MSALAGPFAATAALLLAGGLAKAWSPADTARALRPLLGLPLTPTAIRVLGAAEAATALAALTRPIPLTAAAVAAWYVSFVAITTLALRTSKPISSCGCFGRTDSPPSVAHLVVVAAGALTAAVTTVTPAEQHLLEGQPAYGVPFLALTALATWFAYLVMTRLPELR